MRGLAHIYASSATFAALIQAVVTAEGNIVRAVQCSIPTIQTRNDAIKVVCRSAVHAMADWIAADEARKEAFVAFWADRFAPPNVANDPTHLNANWAPNVERLWTPQEGA